MKGLAMKSTLCSSFLMFSLLFLLISPVRLLLDRNLGSIVQIIACLILSLAVARLNPFGLFQWLEKISMSLKLLIGIIAFIVGVSVSVFIAIRS